MEENTGIKFHNQDNSDIEGSSISAALNHYKKKNYREALQLFMGVSHTNASSDIYLNIGNCYYMLDSLNEALEYWNKTINLDSKNSHAYTNIGNLYYKTGNIKKAISYWLVSLISRPEDANTNLNLALAFNEQGMRFESIKYFEKYIKYEEEKRSENYIKIKSNLNRCFNIANQYLSMGVDFQMKNDYKKAAACYFKSLATYPNLSKTNLNLGIIFFEDKNLELAIKYWKNASHIDPNYDKTYSNLAISYDLKKEFDYAYCYYNLYLNFIMNNKDKYYKITKRLNKIKPFLNKNPDLINKHLDLAQKHLANNEIYDAIDEFRTYSILKPEEQEKYKDIIKKLESYLNPELSIISRCFEIGNKLIREEQFKEAKSYYWRIMKLSSPQYLEFSKARAKYSHCEKAEEGKGNV